MNSSFKKITLCLTVLMLASCSSEPQREEVKLDTQVHSQTPADTPDQIMQRAALAFSNAEGLTADQKTRLASVYTSVYMESMHLRREIGQSKSLLFMTLAKPNYKASEIKELKVKIVKLDQQRLNLMFDALDQVQAIVGKGLDASKIYKHFEDNEMPHLPMQREGY